MTTDLPPDVRAEASRGVMRAMRTKQAGAAVTLEMLHAVVAAVTAVIAPEIARPLWGRVDELEGALGGVAEERDALQVRVEELEAEIARRKRSGEALNTECEQIGEKADEAWRALNPYMARVELLTTALHELAAIADRVCRQVADGTEVDWTGLLRNKVANARAALAAGPTESEARTLDSESKVPDDEVSQVNSSRGKRRGDPKSARCPYGDNGDHEWGPDPDDPDVGDACTLCGVGR